MGNINSTNNYRGITLLSTVGKLFTIILNNRLSTWAEQYFVYIEAQAGFRKTMSTIDHMFVLHCLITKFINKGSTMLCTFVDFTKAFGYVVRDNLWYTLLQLGVKGTMLNINKSIYNNVKTRIKNNNQLSDECPCVLGVRQGEYLSPFLFAMYINDIEDEFCNTCLDGIDIVEVKLYFFVICR